MIAAIAIAVVAGWPRRTSPSLPGAQVRFTILPEPNATILSPDIDLSRDGRLLVYNATMATGERMYMRRLDSFETVAFAQPLGHAPTISPDNESAAFLSRGSLYRVALRGDSPSQLLAQLGGVPLWIDWTRPEALLVSGRETPILRVPAAGGAPTAITEVATGTEVDHHTPRMLPGGDAVLFAIHGVRNRFSVAVQSLTTGARKVLVTNAFKPIYSPTGHLVFGRGSSLLAAAFDLRTLTVTGAPVTVLEGVAADVSSGDISYQLADSGTLVYHPAAQEPRRTLTWVDRRGKETALAIPPRAFQAPRISPDGKRIAFATSENGSRRIWTYEIATETLTPITVEGDNWGPIWTRDGTALAYGTDRTDASHVVVHWLDGKPSTSIGSSINDLWPMSFAADGSLIVSEDPPTDSYRVLRIRPGPSHGLEQIVGGPGFPFMARLSPDGRWLAFEMSQNGRRQVFVEPASGEGPRRQVTIDGGRAPVWSHDGRELFYRWGGRVHAVAVDRGGFGFSKPTILFEGEFVRLDGDYDVAPDGRFVMIKADPRQRNVSELKVILNWSDELLRRAPLPK